MINKNILKIRKKLDKLDNHFLKLIKKRQNLVDQVLKNKKYKKDIIDKKRILVIIKSIRKKSVIKKIDPKVTKRIWSSMIKAFIDYERRNFRKKQLLAVRWKFFSTNISCFLVFGLYFFNLSLSLAFSPFVGFFA